MLIKKNDYFNRQWDLKLFETSLLFYDLAQLIFFLKLKNSSWCKLTKLCDPQNTIKVKILQILKRNWKFYKCLRELKRKGNSEITFKYP